VECSLQIRDVDSCTQTVNHNSSTYLLTVHAITARDKM